MTLRGDHHHPLWRSLVAICTAVLAPLTVQSAASAHTNLPGGRQVRPLNVSDSANWSGYGASGAIFTDVVGSWTQPAVACSGQAQYSSYWVGMDGFLAGDTGEIEQIGTAANCMKGNKKHRGGATYYAWYQFNTSRTQFLPACPVSPGDSVSAEVSASNGSFTMTLNDLSQGTSCPVSEALSAPEISAEWVVEAPLRSTGRSVLPLAAFSSVSFTGAQANGTPIAGLTNHPITMKKGKTVKASPSGLGPDGQSFTVTWFHS